MIRTNGLTTCYAKKTPLWVFVMFISVGIALSPMSTSLCEMLQRSQVTVFLGYIIRWHLFTFFQNVLEIDTRRFIFQSSKVTI